MAAMFADRLDSTLRLDIQIISLKSKSLKIKFRVSFDEVYMNEIKIDLDDDYLLYWEEIDVVSNHKQKNTY